MIPKRPAQKFVQTRQGLKLFFILEAPIFFGSYLLWAACNRSQNTRKFFHETSYLRFIVNFYYKTAELCGNTAVRGYDKETWEAQALLAQREKNDT